ncbi:MAG: Gfo/Idh/MocA family oxidoreductase, partial [Deltaproteobacteria bacterium]|nr:Gfo/Idh/MocA family oxidoreductase [Deltaproteobacteria bacterium]
MSGLAAESFGAVAAKPPRLGFAGTGWIGRARLHSLAESRIAQIGAIFDPASERAEDALNSAPDAQVLSSFDDMLAMDLDGIVIATPSALHAAQSIAALERGFAVFCQKPLGRNEAEAARVINAARNADRLLALDVSYRYTHAIAKMRELVRDGVLGRIFAVDLNFHNAYGPDKDWYYTRDLAGGGCVIDLGVHLIDLALWMLDWPKVSSVESRCYSNGEPVGASSQAVEDYAVASIQLESGAIVRLACSWKLPTIFDAVIAAKFYGTEGGVEFSNEGGSFYDFTSVYIYKRNRVTLSSPPDQWGGRAL